MKTTAITFIVAALLVAGIYFYIGETNTVQQKNTAQSGFVDYKNATYIIEGQSVTLINGKAEAPTAPGSVSKIVTQYFGNESFGDLTNDGVPDIAFILTQDSGGSGTFYYAVAAIRTASGYKGTNAILLGDRIAPQTTQIEYGEAVFNYADRATGEPMTAQPSVGVSKYLKVEGLTLEEVKK